MLLAAQNFTMKTRFPAVGKAFGILSDEEKRRQYDLYGPEAETRSTHRHRQQEYYNDIDPDEIFRMFFGGGFPRGMYLIINDILYSAYGP